VSAKKPLSRSCEPLIQKKTPQHGRKG
jgi:hypothetical protein